MILAKLTDSSRYEAVHPLFGQAFEYILSHDLASVSAGRIELDGDRLFINVCETDLVAAESQKLEVHRRYIDIHVPLEQVETIGWKHISDLGESEAPFDEAGDFALYDDRDVSYIPVHPGEFLAVFPEDAHAPLIGSGHQRKLIVKVLL
ncbi:MAG: YhcH/YjgK/YiaL family protein [Paraprevotella sp.]|nr:YhcH/YjgK/YiaL family protein [Paraprevotella sp.]